MVPRSTIPVVEFMVGTLGLLHRNLHHHDLQGAHEDVPVLALARNAVVPGIATKMLHHSRGGDLALLHWNKKFLTSQCGWQHHKEVGGITD